MSSSTPLACVVLCAGKGTRMKSALPKVLHEAAGRPLFAWPVGEALALAARPVVAVVGHEADKVRAAIEVRHGDAVAIALQAEQKGTGHAVQQAMPSLGGFEGTVVVLYGDTPLVTRASLQRLVALRAEKGAPLALWTTRLADPTGYGRIVRDATGALERIVEQKDATDAERAIGEVNPGVYAFEAAFLRRTLPQLAPNNAQGEYYLTDLVGLARASGAVVPTLEVDVEETIGVNDRVQLADVSVRLRARTAKRAMLEGATLIDPARTLIDAEVVLEPDCVVHPNVSLTGATRVGAGAVIGVGAVLHDTVVHAGAKIHAYTVCEGAEVRSGAEAGPFARLRPAALLEEKSRVGNFVEVKKTTLGKGSKANHLAYLGDAVIGAGVNVGAGTITCNYDGIGKHKTELGDDVFIGSNSTLVAPLVVGKGAYVAAGSVVTKEVPSDALAVGRARQENKEGYAARVRARNASRAKKGGDGH